MLRLLDEPARSGYPAVYLMSRIHGRMEKLVSGAHGKQEAGNTFHADDTLIWNAAAMERRWIYLQMDADLRQALAPMIVYFELHNLVLCLRSLEAHQPDAREVALEQSLLTGSLKKIFSSFDTPINVIGKLEKKLRNSVLKLDGLVAAYGDGGVQKCEELLRQRFLEQAPRLCSCREVAGFFRRIIDLRNIMTLAKCLRWEHQAAPQLIKGGYICLLKAEQVASAAVLDKMVRRFTNGREVSSGELHPLKLEVLLNNHLSRIMARQLRSAGPKECCMGYMWHCFVSARKWSQEYHRVCFADYFPEGPENVQ